MMDRTTPPTTPGPDPGRVIPTGHLLEAVTRMAGLFVRDADPADLFQGLLDDLLRLSDSDYGYIGEVRYDGDTPYLKTWAISDIAWDEVTRALYDTHVVRGEGLEFRNLDTLFGWGLREGGRVMISNDTATDARSSGRPEGHPPLNCFLGIPVFHGAELVGQLGVSNRVEGYDQALVDQLEPFTLAIGNLIDAYRTHRERERAEGDARRRATELSALVGGLRDAVLFEDANHCVVFMNQSFCDLWGYRESPADLVGSTAAMEAWFAAVADPEAEDPPWPEPMLRVLEPRSFAAGIQFAYAHAVPEFGARVRMVDGRVLERDYLPVAQEADDPGHLWIYRDVSDRALLDERRAEVLLREREQRRRAEEQNLSLLELDRLKTDFVATVSHELRTPLTSIVGYAELLQEVGGLSLEAREFSEVIDRNAKRLLDLVSDLLLIARLESGGLTIDRRPTPLRAALLEVVEDFRPAIDAKDLELALDLPDDGGPVHVDPSRFGQVIQNLLSNAVNFTPEGGRISLTARREGTGWVVEVGDTGIGIPADELGWLFDRFYRASNARRLEIAGSGLGLAITRAIVELHGGVLGVQSDGSGTTMRVTFPDRPPDGASGLD